MNACLGEEGVPASSVSPSNISLGVISHHEENSFRLSFSHFMLHKFKCLQLWLSIVNMLDEIIVMPFAMLIKQVVKRAKRYPWFEVSPSPNHIILSREVG